MKVIHSIQFEEQELTDLFELARYCGELEADKTTYSETDKQVAIQDNNKQFEALLKHYLDSAFLLGYQNKV